MELLSEDPRYLAGGLGLLALAYLIALKLTQQGKYLIWAGAALGLALLVVTIERLWVTDQERIERTVYDLAAAVAAGDPDQALTFLADDVRYARGDVTLPTDATRAQVRDLIENTRFDFLTLNRFVANAGAQSRRGKAEFRVFCGGSIQRGSYRYNFGSTHSSWSLGLREVGPGVWKVNRITPVETPRGENILPR
ncbi:MAG: hypothetical protein AB7I30_18110 [Isosphaeraceae bacterium]